MSDSFPRRVRVVRSVFTEAELVQLTEIGNRMIASSDGADAHLGTFGSLISALVCEFTSLYGDAQASAMLRGFLDAIDVAQGDVH